MTIISSKNDLDKCYRKMVNSRKLYETHDDIILITAKEPRRVSTVNMNNLI